MRYELIATATFGLESVVASELEGLGFAERTVEDRRVRFAGEAAAVVRANLWLRAADRVFLLLSGFPAADFDQLFEGVRAIRWREILPRAAAVRVTGRSAKSKLTAVTAVQSVAKKAIVEAIRRGDGHGDRLDESGPQLTVDVSLTGDRAEVLLDTSGDGLHKRGWRIATGGAPLRENLAAGIVLLSRWDASRPFADPLCGSGTIAIEAALIGRRMAPGIARQFAGEALPIVAADLWRRGREEARGSAAGDRRLEIAGSDRDPAVVAFAQANAKVAGVLDTISFRRRDLEAFQPAGDYGCIVTNPPYAVRLGETREVEELYRAMGRLHRRLPTWSWFVLTPHPGFTRLFGARESRNRKLYNGNIRCWLHEYFGPRGAAPFR
jgi:putative N6-adenine-specific DNA methylase